MPKGLVIETMKTKYLVDANTLFAIGSSSKAFTSAVLGKLREDEKLSFNDSPLDYIPELKFYNDEMNNNIIIKDLMRHSTGLPRHDASWYYFPTHSKDSLIKRIEHQEPFTGVRQKWYYNNFMFLAQGVIAERITDKSWEDNVRDYFFKPLGMNRSNATIAEMKSASNAALGYQLKKGDIISKMDYYDIAGMSPAGSINSSVNDMSKWLITWINNGKYKDTQIIPEEYIKEAMSSQMVIGAALPSEELPNMHFANYGYGWMLQSYRGHYRVEHGGNIDGFSASVAFFPSDKIGIVVLTNQNGSAVTGLVRNTISDRLLGEGTTDWTQRYIDRQEKAKKAQEENKDEDNSANVKGTKPSHNKIEYTGTYTNPGYGKFEIIVKNDSLFTKLNTTSQYINHYHYDTFELIDVNEGKVDTTQIGNALKVVFNSNVGGEISNLEIEIEPTLGPIKFKRTPNTIDVTNESLQKYVGSYDLRGNEVKVYIKDENVLYVFLQGQPEYELLPVAEHKFNLKILDGYKVEFTEGEDGTISNLTFVQPNGKFTATKKGD